MSYTKIEMLRVCLQFSGEAIPVGRLALRDHKVYFEYESSFLDSPLDISPFMLPKRAGVQVGDTRLFDGLFGVFNDSLPDGWGRLLLDRAVRAHGVLPSELTPLDRLSYVGYYGMGALCYEPDQSQTMRGDGELDLSRLARQAKKILDGEASDVIDTLLQLNGSSAGARPKIIIGLEEKHQRVVHGQGVLPEGYQHWLVKFSNSTEPIESGAVEYAYYEMAKRAGIEIMESALLPANKGPGYFATKRFDRNDRQKIHMISACGLLHSDFRVPSLDYIDLLKAISALTKNNKDVMRGYRLAVFNVLSHNRDDHSKNIAFLMDGSGRWRLSPAYDLTFSSGPGGEQSTLVLGKGRNITTEDLVDLGVKSQLDRKNVHQIIDQVKCAISQWRDVAKESGVSKELQDYIAGHIGV